MAFLVCGEFWWLKWLAEGWFMRHSPLNAALCLSEKFMVNWPCILKLDGDDELVYLGSEARVCGFDR